MDHIEVVLGQKLSYWKKKYILKILRMKFQIKSQSDYEFVSLIEEEINVSWH